MPSNFILDNKLLEQAMKVGHIRNKQEAVTVALKEFIQRHQQKRILDLAGKISFREDWDFKKDRTTRECNR